MGLDLVLMPVEKESDGVWFAQTLIDFPARNIWYVAFAEGEDLPKGVSIHSPFWEDGWSDTRFSTAGDIKRAVEWPYELSGWLRVVAAMLDAMPDDAKVVMRTY